MNAKNKTVTIEKLEKIIQKRVNDIIQNNVNDDFEKLPGLIESLKIIKNYY